MRKAVSGMRVREKENELEICIVDRGNMRQLQSQSVNRVKRMA